MAFSQKKSFIMITGASRGIGKAITFEFARHVAPGSVLFLIARSGDALADIKDKLTSKFTSVQTELLVADLSKPEDHDFELLIKKVVEKNGGVTEFQQALIVHNAASIGDINKRAVEINNIPQTIDYFKLNVVSPITLNTAFFRVFSSSEKIRRCVVNISSLCGIEPFKSFSLYCSGKAARDMFFKVLASEEPDIDVLNYAPGPVDTEMVSEIVSKSWDKTLVELNSNMKENGTILSPEETSKKLVKILEKRSYKSGDHVDYFDEN